MCPVPCTVKTHQLIELKDKYTGDTGVTFRSDPCRPSTIFGNKPEKLQTHTHLASYILYTVK